MGAKGVAAVGAAGGHRSLVGVGSTGSQNAAQPVLAELSLQVYVSKAHTRVWDLIPCSRSPRITPRWRAGARKLGGDTTWWRCSDMP